MKKPVNKETYILDDSIAFELIDLLKVKARLFIQLDEYVYRLFDGKTVNLRKRHSSRSDKGDEAMNYDELRKQAESLLKECHEPAENESIDFIDIIAIAIEHGFVQGKARVVKV